MCGVCDGGCLCDDVMQVFLGLHAVIVGEGTPREAHAVLVTMGQFLIGRGRGLLRGWVEGGGVLNQVREGVEGMLIRGWVDGIGCDGPVPDRERVVERVG